MPPLHLWSARPLPSHSPKGNPVWLISFQSHFDSNFGTFGVCLPDHKSRRRPIILNSRLPLHVESWKCDRRDRHLPQIDKHWQLDMCSNTKSIPFSGRISPGTNRIRGLIFIVPRFKADLFFFIAKGREQLKSRINGEFVYGALLPWHVSCGSLAGSPLKCEKYNAFIWSYLHLNVPLKYYLMFQLLFNKLSLGSTGCGGLRQHFIILVGSNTIYLSLNV